jgi:hypothetical protein
MPQMVDWFFMNNPACGDIRCGRYLWVYLTAKMLGVVVFFKISSGSPALLGTRRETGKIPYL